MQCSRTFHTAERTIEGREAMRVMRKGRAEFVANLFGVAA